MTTKNHTSLTPTHLVSMIRCFCRAKALHCLAAAFSCLAASQSALAAVVDLGNETVSKTAAEFKTEYGGNTIVNGTVNLGNVDRSQNQEPLGGGTYTIGDSAKVVHSGDHLGINGNVNLNIVDGGILDTGSYCFALPYRYGQSTMTLTGGTLTTSSDFNNEKCQACNFGFVWNNKDDSKSKEISTEASFSNGSTLSVTNGNLRISGAKGNEKRLRTSKTDFAVTNSSINVAKGHIYIGTDVTSSDWLSDTENSYCRVTFGPGSDITCQNIYAYKSLVPEVMFDGATVHKSGSDGNFIGQNTGLSGDIYTLGAGGLTIDIPSDQSFTAGSNMSVLKGTGGITKIGAGSITVNSIVSSSTAGAMTFTGPLVVSNGTWTSSVGYAASEFKANGGTLALSGALSAANVALEATDGGTLTLSGATITDTTPDLTLAGGGTTDYFTRDGAVGTYTLDSLTLGEGAVLDLDGNGTAIDAINATTTNITATSANPATININFTAAPAGGTTFTLFETDSADKFVVNTKRGSLTIPHEITLVNGVMTLGITDDDYTWGASQTNWDDENAWTNGGAAATWTDGKNAVFGTADATATLAADASAAEVRFTASATVFGTANLTVAKVDVASGVTGTISAPTAGALEKTGEGTLTLGASRTDQTTLTEGTLVMSGTASLDWSKFTFGTDSAKPVTLEFGENAVLSGVSGAWNIGNDADRTVTVRKTGGDWSLSDDLVVGALSGATATFTQVGGTLTVPSGKWTKSYGGAGTINLNGGTLITKHICDDKGSLAVNFNGGTLKANAAYSNGLICNKNSNLTVTVESNGGTIDNDGKNIKIAADLKGSGDMTLIGNGTTTIGGSQTGTGALVCNATETILNAGLSVERPVTVKDGKKFTVNATAKSTINSLTLEANSTLNIASYTGGVTPLAVAALNLPTEGEVALKMDGSDFGVGRYAILEKSGFQTSDVEGKLRPSTGGESYSYSVSGNILVLTVGTPAHGRWIASAGGDFNVPGNWGDNQVPVAGDILDFSGVTGNITINCGDMGETFSEVVMGTGVITFTGSFTATSFSDTSKVAVGANSTVTLDGDLVFGGTTKQYIVYTVAAGGRFVVTGHIEASSAMNSNGELFPYEKAGAGAVQAKGLVANEGTSDKWTFRLSSDKDGTANWIVGADGLSGSKYFFAINNSNRKAAIQPLDSDFTIATKVGIRAPLTLNTTGYDGARHTITVSSIIDRDGALTVSGKGTVLVDAVNTHSGGITVTDTATLAINADMKATTGAITVNDGATLQVAQSGTVALGGGLTLKDGAALGFNYSTSRAPVLKLTDRTVTFDEGETTNVVVKISADAGKRANSGKNVLTTGYNFTGVGVSLDPSAPDWALDVSVNANGDIEVDVKPKGLSIRIR